MPRKTIWVLEATGRLNQAVSPQSIRDKEKIIEKRTYKTQKYLGEGNTESREKHNERQKMYARRRRLRQILSQNNQILIATKIILDKNHE